MKKYLFIFLLVLIWSCASPIGKALKNTKVHVGQSVIDKIPIIDKGENTHEYRTPDLEVYGYEEVWCENHQRWEKKRNADNLKLKKIKDSNKTNKGENKPESN